MQVPTRKHPSETHGVGGKTTILVYYKYSIMNPGTLNHLLVSEHLHQPVLAVLSCLVLIQLDP